MNRSSNIPPGPVIKGGRKTRKNRKTRKSRKHRR